MPSLVYTIAQNGYGRAFARCIKSQERYADRIGARFVVIDKPSYVPHPALSAWLKVPVMQHALDEGFDTVAYIDADCEVRADAPDFSQEFRSHPHPVLMANGRSGRLNSGVMLSRQSDEAKTFFNTVRESLTQKISDEARANLKYENGNIIHVANQIGGVSILGKEWNNTEDVNLHDRIRHFSGPMAATYRRSFLDEAFYRLIKTTISRRPAQPVQREADFDKALDDLVADVVRIYPSLSQ